MWNKLHKKPKYKIGDIVVYPDRYFEWRKNKENTMMTIHQSEIIESYAYIDRADSADRPTWFYVTKHIVEDGEDNLDEDDILYKLN